VPSLTPSVKQFKHFLHPQPVGQAIYDLELPLTFHREGGA